MDTTNELKNLSHHSFCLIGGDAIWDELRLFLDKEHSLKMIGNPDYFYRHYESLSIDDAREIKTAHSMRPTSMLGKKVFVIKMNAITIEAQNALLKLLEEPAEYAYFFLIIPGEHLLLPTVKSRLSFIRSKISRRQDEGDNSTASDTSSLEIKNFVKGTYVKRLDIVKKLLDQITKEKKTKQDAIDFLDGVQSFIYNEKNDKKRNESLTIIENARKYMNDRSPSIKILLEYVAVNL
ncbi:MAG: hypothetical protein WC648_00690 [Candidatus Paceibacterota bacterium]|jgi:DNA polymerase III delta prime subunit